MAVLKKMPQKGNYFRADGRATSDFFLYTFLRLLGFYLMTPLFQHDIDLH